MTAPEALTDDQWAALPFIITDDREWPILGFAPGNYIGVCRDCGQQHTGADKRAYQCAPCALQELRRMYVRLAFTLLTERAKREEAEALNERSSERWRERIPQGYQPTRIRKHEATNDATIQRIMQEAAGTEAADLIAWLVWHNCKAWEWGEIMTSAMEAERAKRAAAEETVAMMNMLSAAQGQALGDLETQRNVLRAEVARMRGILGDLLLSPEIADCAPEDKDPATWEAEKRARAALAPAPEDQP